MATQTLWPNVGVSEVTEEGAPITTSGVTVPTPLTKHYRDRLASTRLLTYDPLGLSGVSVTLNPAAGQMSVRSFGAVGDGATDDSAALRTAIASGVPLFFPPGTYLVSVPEAYWSDPVNGHALHIRDVTGLDWVGYGATIKMSSATWYTGRTANLKLQNCADVSIKGITFDGNRSGRGVTGIGGASCVDIMGGTRGKFTDVRVIDACMEGLHLAPTTPSDLATYPTDYEFTNLQVENAYRNGIAVIGGRRITFRGGYAVRTNGTAPGAGLDLEPNLGDEHGLSEVTLDGFRAEDNEGWGVLVTGSHPEVASQSGTGNGTVTDLSVYGEAKVGEYVLSCIAAAAHGGTFRLTDPDGVVVTSSLVMTAGAGVGTTFRAGGLQFTLTDGSTDFGTDKVFRITGGQSHTRGVQITNLSGRGNGIGLLDFVSSRDHSLNGLSATDDDTAFTNPGLVHVARDTHGVRLAEMLFGSITAAATKACVYIDNQGTGHAIAGITARNITCRGVLSPCNGVSIERLVVDGASGNEAAVELTGSGTVVRDGVFSRCANYAVRMSGAGGSSLSDIRVNDPIANSIRITSAGVTIRNVQGYHSGNAPGALIQFDAAATPLCVENVSADAAGTPYTRANVVALPTDKAFRCSRVSPNPFSGELNNYDPGSLPPGASTDFPVTLNSAAVGDQCFVRHSVSLQGLISTVAITAANTATVTLLNPTGGAIDLGSHTVTVEVVK